MQPPMLATGIQGAIGAAVAAVLGACYQCECGSDCRSDEECAPDEFCDMATDAEAGVCVRESVVNEDTSEADD